MQVSSHLKTSKSYRLLWSHNQLNKFKSILQTDHHHLRESALNSRLLWCLKG